MRKDYDSNCNKAEQRLNARWERNQEFNERLGRRRKVIAQPTAQAHRRRILEKVNQLATETNWRGDLARSVRDVIEMEDCSQVYGEQHAAE